MVRHYPSQRGISRPRETDIDYGAFLGPPMRDYERAAMAGEIEIPVDVWDQLATSDTTSRALRAYRRLL